ncbi:MAG: hypothetical protein QXZ09_09615 [Candidatus Methanomethylicaceae archaeon]
MKLLRTLLIAGALLGVAVPSWTQEGTPEFAEDVLFKRVFHTSLTIRGERTGELNPAKEREIWKRIRTVRVKVGEEVRPIYDDRVQTSLYVYLPHPVTYIPGRPAKPTPDRFIVSPNIGTGLSPQKGSEAKRGSSTTSKSRTSAKKNQKKGSGTVAQKPSR